MSSVIIITKTQGGLLIPARPVPEPDGMHWTCGVCGVICARVSFGIMNGLYRCQCGGTVEITVDGRVVYIAAHKVPNPPEEPTTVAEQQQKNDEEFMKSCGISSQEDDR